MPRQKSQAAFQVNAASIENVKVKPFKSSQVGQMHALEKKDSIFQHWIIVIAADLYKPQLIWRQADCKNPWVQWLSAEAQGCWFVEELCSLNQSDMASKWSEYFRVCSLSEQLSRTIANLIWLQGE